MSYNENIYEIVGYSTAYFDNEIYIDDNKLVFSVYEYENKEECNYYKCFCRTKESKVVEFNFEELTYKTTYSLPNNSYLIDISSDKIVYYNNGNIYINEEKTKDVDNIVPKGEYMQKYSSVSLKGKTKWLDAFLAYYNDKTYVRMDDYSDNLKEIY